jgi:basic membrane protein A and related proteins
MNGEKFIPGCSKMKHKLPYFILMLLIASLPACRSERAGVSGGAQNLPDGQTLKICLLDTNSADGQSWVRNIYQTLQDAENDLRVELHLEAAESWKDYEKMLHAYGKQACVMVVGEGLPFEEAALSISSQYPETFFFAIDSNVDNNANVAGLSVDARQPFYLLGVLAAEMGSRAGLVGGAETTPVTEAFAGFVEGAHSVDPGFPVSEVYLDDWVDAAGGKQAALELMAGGADFVVPYAGAAAIGVYHAVVEENNWTFGVIRDQIAQAPKNITASYVVDYGQAVKNIIADIRTGAFELNGNIVFGLVDEDVVLISYNEGSDNPVSQALRDEVEEIRAMIAAVGIDQ